MTCPFDIPEQLRGFKLLPVNLVAQDDGTVKKPPATSREWSALDYEPTDEEWAGADAYGVRLYGVVVVDIDKRPPKLVQQWFDSVDTLTVRTPRGFHFYFAGTNSTLAAKPPYGDVKRGPNQYVVGPGSPGYSVINDAPLARASMLERLYKVERLARGAAAGKPGHDTPVAPVGPGNHNVAFFNAATCLEGQGFSEQAVTAALEALYEHDGADYDRQTFEKETLTVFARHRGRRQ